MLNYHNDIKCQKLTTIQKRFSLIVEQIPAFASSTNLAIEVNDTHREKLCFTQFSTTMAAGCF